LVSLTAHLETFGRRTCIGNVSSTIRCRSSTKKTKNGILNVIRIVLRQQIVDSNDNVPVCVFLGNLTLLHERSRAGCNGTDKDKSEERVLHCENGIVLSGGSIKRKVSSNVCSESGPANRSPGTIEEKVTMNDSKMFSERFESWSC
jgi:hypothetical protein